MNQSTKDLMFLEIYLLCVDYCSETLETPDQLLCEIRARFMTEQEPGKNRKPIRK